MRSELAPIAIFAYRRVEHLSRALDALEQCPEFSSSRVFIFSDGPKSSQAAQEVDSVRALIRSRLRRNMTLVEAGENKGLAVSISNATTQLCDEFGCAIVIEDDLLVSPCTLAWFNAGLQRYKDDYHVFQIAAHQFDVPEFAERNAGLFLHLTSSWGWATWKRAWDRYDPMALGWERLKGDKELRDKFNVGGQQYFEMLCRQMEGKIDSWAIRWWWTVFSAGGVSLFPPRSLINNIGFDHTATNLKLGWLRRRAELKYEPPTVLPLLPNDVVANPADDALLRASLQGKRRGIVDGAIFRLHAIQSILRVRSWPG